LGRCGRRFGRLDLAFFVDILKPDQIDNEIQNQVVKRAGRTRLHRTPVLSQAAL
jgi:hypothetical protein